MNWALIVSVISGLIPVAQKIGKIWESSGGFNAIAEEILNSGIINSLEEVGAQLFPQVEKKIQSVLAAIHLGYPDATKWIQKALNTIQATGYIHFGDPLVVDGVFGPLTYAAVVVLQAKVGLKPTGAVADAEYKVINALLEGKTP